MKQLINRVFIIMALISVVDSSTALGDIEGNADVHGETMDAIPAFVGTYDLQVKFGERVFSDVMEIEEAVTDPNFSYRYRIKGTLTVPGIFSVPFEGSYCPHEAFSREGCVSYNRGLLSIRFTVDEGGGPVEYLFITAIFDERAFSGRIYVDGESIGSFTGGRRDELDN